jgi:hypothetical protein
MKRWLPVLVGVVLGLTVAWAAGPDQGERQPPGNAAARAAAARKVLKGMRERRQQDPAAPLDPEKQYLWSRRWMEADREVAATKAARLAAVEGHLARMRELEKIVTEFKGGGFMGATDLAAAEFYRLDAEAVLAQEKGR